MTTADESSIKPIIEQERIETPLAREALYALVWAQPMTAVAARFGLSSSYLARICNRMNVPRPDPGYWAKLAVGKAKTQPPLPAAQPGDDLVWSREGDNAGTVRSLPKPPVRVLRKRSLTTAPRPDQHPLLIGAKTHFETGRLSYEGDYLKPAKKLLVDLAVTKAGLDKALSFANELFLSLEDNGHRVLIAPHGEFLHREEVDEREEPHRNRGYNNLWSPWRSTVVYIGTVAIGLTVIEMSEEVEVRYVNGKFVREEDYVPPKRGRYTPDNTWTTK